MAKILSLRRAKVIALLVVVSFVSVFSLVLVMGKGANAQSIPACTDSDSTPDYYGLKSEQISKMTDNSKYIKGTISAPDANGFWRTALHHQPDECETSNKIREHYCDRGKYFGYTILDCPNGCKDGACVKAPVEEPKLKCTDSDSGKEYNVKGTVNFKNPSNGSQTELSDYCLSSEKEGYVAEYYCSPYDSSGAIRIDYNCPNGCNDGACTAESSEGEEEEEEDAEIRAGQIKQIQELIIGISGMDSVLRGVNVMEKTFKTLAKQGIDMPSDLAEIIARAKEINPEIIKFKNSKAENVADEEAGTLTDNMNEMCGISSTLEEFGSQIPQFLQLSAKMKQASTDLKKAKSDVARAVKIAAKPKFAIPDKVDELNSAVEALKTTLDDVNASAGFDDKDYKINEFYDQFRSIYDMIGVINALQNAPKAKVEWSRRVKANALTISQLSKNAELDVSELVAKNDEIKAKIDGLGTALARKPIDRDEKKWIFEDLKTVQSEFIYIADQLSGVNSALPKVKVAKFDTSQFKKIGAFSQFCEPQE